MLPVQERDSGLPCGQSQDSTNVDGGDSTKDKLKEEEHLDCPYYMIMHIILRYVTFNIEWFLLNNWNMFIAASQIVYVLIN